MLDLQIRFLPYSIYSLLKYSTFMVSKFVWGMLQLDKYNKHLSYSTQHFLISEFFNKIVLWARFDFVSS